MPQRRSRLSWTRVIQSGWGLSKALLDRAETSQEYPLRPPNWPPLPPEPETHAASRLYLPLSRVCEQLPRHWDQHNPPIGTSSATLDWSTIPVGGMFLYHRHSIRTGTTCPVDTIGTRNSMGWSSDGKPAEQNHDCKRNASHDNPDFATGINLFLSIFDYKPR